VKLNKTAFMVPATALVALTLSMGTANAGQRTQQDDRRSAGQRQGSRAPDAGQAQRRNQQPAPAQQRPQAQAQTQRPSSPAPQVQSPRPQQQQTARPQYDSRVAPQRQGAQPSRVPYRGDVSPRSYDSRGYQGSTYGSSGSYGSSYGSRSYAPSYSSGRYYNSRPRYQPYYSFRPRFSLGFGIYLGYPVGFPSWYDPYVPGAYSYYRPGVSYGGVSLDIQPYDAGVYVDGTYMGIVEDFDSTQPPLTLTAGRHHIDLESQGAQPMSFDITVVPRQVIPYQGTLSRY